MGLPPARHLATTLGVLYLAMGVAEVVTHRDDTALALAFWGTSLLGGGALLLAGRAVWTSRPMTSLVLVIVGAVLALPATAWTLLVPLLAITVVVLTVREQGDLAGGGSGPAAA